MRETMLDAIYISIAARATALSVLLMRLTVWSVKKCSPAVRVTLLDKLRQHEKP